MDKIKSYIPIILVLILLGGGGWFLVNNATHVEKSEELTNIENGSLPDPEENSEPASLSLSSLKSARIPLGVEVSEDNYIPVGPDILGIYPYCLCRTEYTNNIDKDDVVIYTGNLKSDVTSIEAIKGGYTNKSTNLVLKGDNAHSGNPELYVINSYESESLFLDLDDVDNINGLNPEEYIDNNVFSVRSGSSLSGKYEDIFIKFPDNEKTAVTLTTYTSGEQLYSFSFDDFYFYSPKEEENIVNIPITRTDEGYSILDLSGLEGDIYMIKGSSELNLPACLLPLSD